MQTLVYFMQVNATMDYYYNYGEHECYCLDYYNYIYDGDQDYYCTPVQYYCYDYFYICWTELYDSEGYCLDWCEYGYDYETLECYAEETWTIFSESPYKCLDAFWCATTAPGSDASVWAPYEDDDGNGMDFKVGFFEVSQDTSAPCLPWDRYVLDWNQIKLYDGQTMDAISEAAGDNAMVTSGSVEYQSITYLCW